MALPTMLEKSLTVPNDPIWRLTVEQYHQMIQDGILTDDDPVELLEGLLVTKAPKMPLHSLTTQLTREALARVIPDNWFVEDQEPITTADSEPEPDVAIIRGNRRDYRENHPTPEAVALVVEVAERDRILKLRLYANAGIPVYWILNLPDQQLEVYSQPKDGDYQTRVVHGTADSVAVVIDGQEVGQLVVGELLE